jgi:predicted ATP-grasp superfamily ATP-dependent carboligase
MTNVSRLRRHRFITPTPRRSTTIGALVIGGDYRGLGVVRSLGRRGVPIWVLTDNHLVAGTSRYAQRRLPWSVGNEAEQVAYLVDLATQEHLDGWTVFPSGDESAAFLARNSAKLGEYFRLTVPPWDIIRWAYDKRLTHQLADTAEIDHPRTYYPRCREEVSELDCVFPVILKPAVKVESNDFTNSKAWRVDNAVQLLAQYDLACKLVDPNIVMVQELIPGDGSTQVSYAALCKNGRPLARITARRTRQYPMDFGRFSSCVETADLPEVEELAERLLLDIGYTGLVEAEFKYDERDHRYKLLDLNPRVWGWHSLAQRAGVDFPYLTWLMVQNEPVPEVRAQSNIRWMHLLADMSVAALEIWRGHLSLWSYVGSFRGPVEFAMFAADDPLPAILDVPLMIYQELKREPR